MIIFKYTQHRTRLWKVDIFKPPQSLPMRADEQYPKYPEYRADLPHHYPPPPSFDQRYVRTLLKHFSQDFKQTYWPDANFHFLDLSGFWARPIQSSWAWTPTKTTSTLRSTASQSGGSQLLLQDISTLVLQWLRSPSVREPQLSSTRCCLASVETGSGAHNCYVPNIVHKNRKVFL